MSNDPAGILRSIHLLGDRTADDRHIFGDPALELPSPLLLGAILANHQDAAMRGNLAMCKENGWCGLADAHLIGQEETLRCVQTQHPLIQEVLMLPEFVLVLSIGRSLSGEQRMRIIAFQMRVRECPT